MRQFLILAAFIATPVLAQEAPGLDADADADAGVFKGDWLIVGVGVASIPSYEGSDSGRVIPALGVVGRIGGVGISPRAAGLALNFVPQGQGEKLTFNLGPVLRYRANRSMNPRDPVVARLPRLSGILEGGVSLGATVHRVFNGHDMLSIGTDLRWDITGKGGGMIVSPAIGYFTPLSRAQVFGIQASAEWVDERYAGYNFSISPAGSAASGLPVYKARGGFKSFGAGAFTARDLSGNFLDGGFAIGAGGYWTRLYGSAAETPTTSLRGSASQWIAGAGLSYTF